MKLTNQFSLMPICNFTVAVANHSCYSRRIVRIVWQRDELVMWFETAFAMICMDYDLLICRRESTFAFSFRSFSWVDQKRYNQNGCKSHAPDCHTFAWEFKMWNSDFYVVLNNLPLLNSLIVLLKITILFRLLQRLEDEFPLYVIIYFFKFKDS